MEHIQHKKLYRSRTNRTFAGICGGLAEYFDIDVVILRLLWVLIVIFSGVFPGVIVYLLAILIVPEAPESNPNKPLF